jgi:hypothetical protein
VSLSFVLVNAQAQSQAKAAATPAATPKMADGHPDLNGQWYHRIGPPAPQVKPGESYDAAIAKPVGINMFNPGKPTYKPEFVEKVKDLDKRQVEVDPAWYCQPPGVPRIGPPQKIVQNAKEIVFLYDDLNGNFFRVVRMNAQHRTDIDPSAHGDSIGRWAEALVVAYEPGQNHGSPTTARSIPTRHVVERRAARAHPARVIRGPALAQPWGEPSRAVDEDLRHRGSAVLLGAGRVAPAGPLAPREHPLGEPGRTSGS